MDENLAHALLALGPPTKDNLPDMAALLQRCQPDKKTCIVIDNYQLFEHSAPRKFLAVLAACPAENLHVVVITQPLPAASETICQSHHSLVALRIALPDRMYLPFAKFAAELTPLLKKILGQTSLEFHEGLGYLLAYCARYAKGRRTVCARRQEKSSLMTAREKDVARLACDRLSVEEIASALQVSPNTVKTILNNVYRKLGVKGKVGLRDKT